MVLPNTDLPLLGLGRGSGGLKGDLTGEREEDLG
jgi:hypothetical protein